MNRNYPIGISDFKKVIQSQSTFIDKTLFIKDIMDNHAAVILITRPRRFGKTMNMSMLQRFLELDGDMSLFNSLKITEHAGFCEAHQNKYPVIFLSFKDVKAMTFEEMYSDIKGVVATLYDEHSYLLEGEILSENEKRLFDKIQNKIIDEPSDLSLALYNLIVYVKRKHGVAPIFLLDEYDTPIHSAYSNKFYAELINLMRKILGATLKDNSHLGKAVITGITRVSKESLFSGLNHVEVHTLLDKEYAPYFGFTESEVQSLLPEEIKIEPIREWYNGYTIGDYQIYNPWSILNCLKKDGRLSTYWIGTSDNALLSELIERADISLKLNFERLLRGEYLDQEINDRLTFAYLQDNDDAIWNLLLHTGYLNVVLKREEGTKTFALLSIPNMEIKSLYQDIIKDWFAGRKSGSADYIAFLNTLEKGDVEGFTRGVRKYLDGSCSYFDLSKKTPEVVFHLFMLGLFVGFQGKYEVTSNREAGKGRYDVLLRPLNSTSNSIILEFKTCKNPERLEESARDALAQIEAKRYISSQNTLKIGFAFCGKEVISAANDGKGIMIYKEDDEDDY